MESRNPKEDFSSPGSSSEGATSYACFICFMSFPAHHGRWNSLWSPSTKSPSQLKEFIFHCSIVQSTWSWRIFFFSLVPRYLKPHDSSGFILFFKFGTWNYFWSQMLQPPSLRKVCNLLPKWPDHWLCHRQCGHKDCSDNANLHGHQMMRWNQERGTGAQGTQFIALGVPAVPSFCD